LNFITIKTIRVLITGRVQGVWYRASTKQKAEQLDIKGWVRNTDEGNVEAVFQGREKNIDDMLKWCHKGPMMADVKKVEIIENLKNQHFEVFKIKH